MSHEPGPYDPKPPTLQQIQRARILWTPPPWEAWQAVETQAGARVVPVVAGGRVILYASQVANADLTAAAPVLYDAVIALLKFFDPRPAGVYCLTESGEPALTPRHMRGAFAGAYSALARAHGRAWW